MLKNTDHTFGLITKLFHWVIALLIIAMLIVGCVMTFTHKATFQLLMLYHQSMGVTILILMLLRLMWRLCNKTPQLPHSMNRLEQKLAHAMAWLLYVLIFSIIAAGLLMTVYHGSAILFWGFALHLPVTANKSMAHFFNQAHVCLAWILLASIILHISASLYHHFIRKDGILKRMM
jgi:cytochrome b561